MEIFNTLTRKKEEFKALKYGEVTMYTCGPTVYNYVHLGNLRTFVFYDILKRVFEFNGYKVKHIMNLTDVDDKTIKGSIESRMSLKEYTEIYSKYFFEDIKKLNIEDNIDFTKATDNIEEMQDIIEKLLKSGNAYEAEDGIYFKVSSFADYGKLSGMQLNGKYSRIINDNYDKENAADFALWKYWDQNDGNVFWEGKLKKGRPGWHIECSAMSLKYLGDTIDVHCGAVDLIFPHHENEIAQSEAYTGKKFADYWVHGEHLLVNGQKMSKSLGNFYTLRDITQQGFNPLSFRLMVLDSHYRNKLDFTFDSLRKYEKTLSRIDLSRRSLEKLERVTGDNLKRNQLKEKADSLLNDFKAALNNDLDTHSALSIFFSILDLIDSRVKEGSIDTEEYDALNEAVKKMDSVLSLSMDYDIPKDVEEIAQQRQTLRESGNFTEADTLRDRINEKGYAVNDLKKGFVISKRYLE